MRLFEIATPTYYAHFEMPLPVGEVVERPGNAKPLGGNLESRLETARPPTALPRGRSFYLSTNASSDAAFIYIIEPVGPIDRNHTAWLEKLRKTNVGDTDEMAFLIDGYWTGNPFPDDQGAWEQRCLKVKVGKRVGGDGLNAPGSTARENAKIMFRDMPRRT